MRPPKLAAWPSPLWLAGWCSLLAAVYASAQDEMSQLTTKKPGPLAFPRCSGQKLSGPLCPSKRKSVMSVASLTKATVATPTPAHHHISHDITAHHTIPKKRTTAHHHKKHSTTHHKKHTTTAQPTPAPTNHTTAHHKKHTTSHRCPTTTHPQNHSTSHPHPTTAPTNHTTAHHKKHTTSHPHPTTAPTNHTTAHHKKRTTAHPQPSPAPTRHTTAHHVTRHTTAHHHTVAPPPTQTPGVPVGNYVVHNGTAVCLRAQTGLQFQVRYTSTAKQQLWGLFAVPANHTKHSGNCSSKISTLDLRFPEGYLIFTFQKNETQNIFYLSRVQANLTNQFPQARETSFAAHNSSLHEFEAHIGNSYQCKNRSLALAEGFYLNALNERIQAFGLQGGEFGDAEVCPEQRRSNVLPIVVGVGLGLLILIVLAAVAVGRCRNRQGYQTL